MSILSSAENSISSTFQSAFGAGAATLSNLNIPGVNVLATGSGDSQLIAQSERLFTTLPRQSLRGQEHDYAALYVKNFNSSKATTYQGLADLQKAVTDTTNGFSSFLLTSYSLDQVERSQLVPVFGGGIAAYFFGQQPIYLTITGNIPDDVDNQWFLQFATAYQAFLRGTQLARNYETMVFLLPNMTVEGAILDLKYSQDASRWVDIPFTCTILVRSLAYRPTIFGGTLNAPQLFTGANSALTPANSMAAINAIKTAVAGLGLGASTPTENIASINDGSVTPSNIGANINDGSATPASGNAYLSVASSLMDVQSNLLPGSNGSSGGASSWLTNAFSSVTGFLKTLSGYISDVQSYIQDAINDSGIGSFLSLVEQAGGDINSLITTVSGLVSQGENAISSIVGEVASIPTSLLSVFNAPLANLSSLEGSFTNFVDQLIALPTTISQYEQSALNQVVAATVPLASPPLFQAGSGTNGLTLTGSSGAGLGTGGAGSSSGAGLGTGGSGSSSGAGLGAGSGSGSGTGASLGSGTSSTNVVLSSGTGASTPTNEPALL